MEKIRFIVRARNDGTVLDDFLASIGSDATLELVDTIGPAGRPHTAVIATDAHHAPRFEQQFSNHPQLIVERDRPLSLFGKTASFLHRSERKNNA